MKRLGQTLLICGFLCAQIVHLQKKVINDMQICGGNGVVQLVIVEPCSNEPCMFQRPGQIKVHIEAGFDRPSETAKLSASAMVKSRNLTLPGVPNNLCRLTSCPLNGRGDIRNLSFTVPIKSFYPPGTYELSFVASGDDGMEICRRLNVTIITDQ
ncbi:hypothetical protein BIW11_12004 [Tropilaelaps mercedesae]|uniref:MD-2-related lipid-recognition domain-containing protein n=1 Tax=Tropilaelaps mercedesae TaxID=418985 RepID=A0A1V9X8H8_9ACAR|nr:hypothetical protein BIW11_12004 [Tropilaelaps mercedesae]